MRDVRESCCSAFFKFGGIMYSIKSSPNGRPILVPREGEVFSQNGSLLTVLEKNEFNIPVGSIINSDNGRVYSQIEFNAALACVKSRRQSTDFRVAKPSPIMTSHATDLPSRPKSPNEMARQAKIAAGRAGVVSGKELHRIGSNCRRAALYYNVKSLGGTSKQAQEARKSRKFYNDFLELKCEKIENGNLRK